MSNPRTISHLPLGELRITAVMLAVLEQDATGQDRALVSRCERPYSIETLRNPA